MKSSNPLYGKKHSEVRIQDLKFLTEEQYNEFLEWSVQQTLKYMVAEGIVETSVCSDTGETLYRKIS